MYPKNTPHAGCDKRVLTLSLALHIAHGPYSLEPSERVHALTLPATLKETFPRAHPREACFVTPSAP